MAFSSNPLTNLIDGVYQPNSTYTSTAASLPPTQAQSTSIPLSVPTPPPAPTPGTNVVGTPPPVGAPTPGTVTPPPGYGYPPCPPPPTCWEQGQAYGLQGPNQDAICDFTPGAYGTPYGGSPGFQANNQTSQQMLQMAVEAGLDINSLEQSILASEYGGGSQYGACTASTPSYASSPYGVGGGYGGGNPLAAELQLEQLMVEQSAVTGVPYAYTPMQQQTALQQGYGGVPAAGQFPWECEGQGQAVQPFQGSQNYLNSRGMRGFGCGGGGGHHHHHHHHDAASSTTGSTTGSGTPTVTPPPPCPPTPTPPNPTT